jgi:hypothetical protein
MTSTVLDIENIILESETAQNEWVNDVMRNCPGHHSPSIVQLSQQWVDTSLSIYMSGPVYGGQTPLAALNFVAPWRDPVAEGSTGLIVVGPQTEEVIKRHLERILELSADEVFFDGMESRLSFGLKHLLAVGGNSGIQAIRFQMDSGSVNAEAVGEILRVLGDFDDRRTQCSRLSLLLDCLKSPDSRIRDAASIGIASLDDPSALLDVEDAAEKEPFEELRKDLQLVVDQLRAGRCQSS